MAEGPLPVVVIQLCRAHLGSGLDLAPLREERRQGI
jgi:hypothetical protein